MAQVTFTIPNEKVQKVITALKGLHPIPTTTDADGVITNNFTDNEWMKEVVRRWIIKQVARYEQKTAKEAVKYNPDDALIS